MPGLLAPPPLRRARTGVPNRSSSIARSLVLTTAAYGCSPSPPAAGDDSNPMLSVPETPRAATAAEPATAAPRASGSQAPSTPEPSQPPDKSPSNETQLTSLASAEAPQTLQFVALPDATPPLTLRQFADPRELSAHLRVPFAVLDAEGRAVNDLTTSDFHVVENGRELPRDESALQIARANDPLVVPVVLVLDLSRSVVVNGLLPTIRQAATTVIDSLGPNQPLSILVFADETRRLTPFGFDRALHRTAIANLAGQEGLATNFFGAMLDAYGLWDEGVSFADGADAGAPPSNLHELFPANDHALIAGVVVAISDGNDTASVASLRDATEARGAKPTVLLNPGPPGSAGGLAALASAGTTDLPTSNEQLSAQLRALFSRTSQLSEALYAAEYCSAKRAGQHTLSISLHANELLLGEDDDPLCSADFSNLQSSASSLDCPGTAVSCTSSGGQGICCPAEHPFACPTQGVCRTTAAQARSLCPNECVSCNRATGAFVPEDGLIEVPFRAEGFSLAQCNALFDAVQNAPVTPPRPAPPAVSPSLVDAGFATDASHSSPTP